MKKIEIREKENAGTKRNAIGHSVNLNEAKQPVQLVRSCYLNIAKRTRLFGLLNATPNDTCELSVECNPGNRLIIRNINKLFVINWNGIQANKHEIKINENKLDFQLNFNPNEIIDCRDIESQEPTYTIDYSIKLHGFEKGEKKEIHHLDGNIKVSIAKLNDSAPIFEFEPNEDGNSLTYSLTQTAPLHIGDLKIKHSGRFLRCPMCDVVFNISCKECNHLPYNGTEASFLHMKDEVKQSHPRIIDDRRISKKDSGVPTDFHALIDTRNGKLQRLAVNKPSDSAAQNDNIVSIPLFWDMTKVSNPSVPVQEYTLRVEMEYSYGNNQISTAFQDFCIKLHKNTKQMDLEVQLMEDTTEIEVLKNGSLSNVLKPEMIAGAKTAYRVVLKNTAEAAEMGKEEAKIFIRDFELNLPSPGMFTYTEHPDSNTHLFTRKENSLEEQVKSLAIGINEARSYNFEYDHTCIDKVFDVTGNVVFKRELEIPLSFSYYIDKNAEYPSADDIKETEWKTYRSALRILIEKEPKPEWLCIDYGTSAIVGTYGAQTVDEHGNYQDRLLELKETKRDNMNKWLEGDSKKIEDNTESDSHLITSAVVISNRKNDLNEGDIIEANKNVKNYMDSPIWTSPTSGLLSIYSRMLPSLKTLIGNKYMPAQLLPQGVRLTGNLSVNSLFELVYNQLFSLFLPEDTRRTNKLILTIPNTYAPCHIELIKNLAHRSLPELRPDYLRFISESDAVAFFYLSKKNEFIAKTKELHNIDFAKYKDFDSKVLVYDMGAGTLDLTYFEQERKGEKNHITIKGKMGVTKAGNYLDYLIADIIVNSNEKLKKNLGNLLSLQIKKGEIRDEKKTAALKDYVRNEVKPILNKGDEPLPHLVLRQGNDMEIDLKVGEIIGHPDFRQYLKDVSESVFSHFLALFSDVKPKLVIFSGRTTSLNCIRTAVSSALETLRMTDSECLFLDLSTGLISNNITTVLDKDINNLKTVVANGALAFCSDFSSGRGNYILHNKNVYAQYGVMFKIGNEWIWENLIDTHTQPTKANDGSLSEYGYSIYEYDSSLHDASEAESIGNFVGSKRSKNRDFTSVAAAYILQSYSKDTLKDWRNGERDMISVIGYADLSNVNGNKDYKLTIESDNSLHFYVGAAQMTLFAHDEYEALSFKKSMWPVVRR